MLEALFTAGELMIARRENFQRVYDLRERVHPGWDDDRSRRARTRDRALVLTAVRALGMATARWVADYFRMPKREHAGRRAARWRTRARCCAVEVEGWTEPAYIHPDTPRHWPSRRPRASCGRG